MPTLMVIPCVTEVLSHFFFSYTFFGHTLFFTTVICGIVEFNYDYDDNEKAKVISLKCSLLKFCFAGYS